MTLAPHEKQPLCVLKDEAFHNLLKRHGMSLEASYFDRLGTWQTLTISFLNDDLLLTPAGHRPPGFLLNTFEAVSSTWNYLRLRRHLKRKQKVSHDAR